jgi:hypothetical protein
LRSFLLYHERWCKDGHAEHQPLKGKEEAEEVEAATRQLFLKGKGNRPLSVVLLKE